MENKDKLKNRDVETLADDMVKVIENDRGGLIKKIIHEEEEHEALKKSLSPESGKNKIFMYSSVALLCIALIVFIVMILISKDGDVVSVIPQIGPNIFLDKTDFKAIDRFTKDKIIEVVSNQSENTNVKMDGVEGIYLTENKKVIGFRRFIDLLEGRLTKSDTESIGDNFLLGVVNKDMRFVSSVSGHFFVLFKVKSFSDVFPVMKNWEGNMLSDLHGFFGVDISPATDYLFVKSFEDGIVENKNARILRDNNGNVILMYVFINDTSVMITNSGQATNEIILRITSSQIRK